MVKRRLRSTFARLGVTGACPARQCWRIICVWYGEPSKCEYERARKSRT
jgi:hypothetical protein